MAKHSIDILLALRNTSEKLQSTTAYQWGHMGSCNCGFLVQEITLLSKDTIHQYAMQKHGDWQTQIKDYCPSSGLLIDDIISQMLAFGFDADDLKHLETLSDPNILQTFPLAERNLKRNDREDVVKYLNRWADMIEDGVVNQERISKTQLKLTNVVR